MCGGGGSSAPTQQTVTQTNIPEWATPYATRLLGEAEALTYGQPYQSYEGQRVAGLNPLQQQAISGIAGLGPAQQIGQASGLAALAGQRAGELGASYQPAQAQNFYQAPQMGALNLGYGTISAPNATAFQMAGPQNVGVERVQAAQMGAAPQVQAPNLQQYQMGQYERVGADRFGTQAMQDYMSPYMSGVIEQQKRGAVQDYMKTLPQLGAQAVRAGAKGGTREAILESEARRGLAEQLGGIEATGLQSAFQQAQQQFGADRAAQMQAALANQQAGLTTGQQNLAALLGIQQLGAQTGLQAQLANQQAGITTGQQNLQAQMQAGLANQQAAQQAALANQQMGYNVGQQNLQAQINQAQFAAQQAMQAGQLNQAAQLQAQAQQLQQQQALNQAALQNAAQQAQYGLAGAQFGEASRQFGANLGLQGLQQQLAAAGTLGQMGQQQFGQQQAALQMQQQAGTQMQQLEQQRLDQLYQDFMARQRYPYSQLGFMSDIIRGIPATAASQQIYQAAPSPLSTMAGLGAMYYGAQRG